MADMWIYLLALLSMFFTGASIGFATGVKYVIRRR